MTTPETHSNVRGDHPGTVPNRNGWCPICQTHRVEGLHGVCPSCKEDR